MTLLKVKLAVFKAGIAYFVPQIHYAMQNVEFRCEGKEKKNCVGTDL